MSKSHQFNFEFSTFEKEELSDSDNTLVDAAMNACSTAYAPYSKFTVGAALLLEGGEIVTGSNQENAAYPSGLCAERVAIFHAASNYPSSKIIKIAIAAKKLDGKEYLPVTPCGSCRQVMLEYEEKQTSELEIILQMKDEWAVIPRTAHLLPFCFDRESLG